MSERLPGETMPRAFGRVEPRHVVLGGVLHGAGVETGDLVVRLVRGDVGPGREFLLHGADALNRDAVLLEPCVVGGEVPAHLAQEDRLLAEQGQVVGDVAARAAEPLVQAVHQETDVQDVNLVGQDMVGEFVGKGHDAVKGKGAGNVDLHFSSRMMAFSWARG